MRQAAQRAAAPLAVAMNPVSVYAASPEPGHAACSGPGRLLRRCLQILRRLEVPFETVDILTDDMLRQGMKDYSQVRGVRWRLRAQTAAQHLTLRCCRGAR